MAISSDATIRKTPASGKISHSAEWFSWIDVLINLHINGEPRQFPASLSVSGLVELLELQGKRVAIERNGEIVPRSQYPETTLADGDRLEIVVAVGGG
jgi:sulfur carrier protein